MSLAAALRIGDDMRLAAALRIGDDMRLAAALRIGDDMRLAAALRIGWYPLDEGIRDGGRQRLRHRGFPQSAGLPARAPG
jgi:hypothetical protein